MRSIKIVMLLILTGILSSCEEPADIELKEASPSLVVEALVTDSVGPFAARLTTTKDFFSVAPAPSVTDAIVTISDNTGITDTLRHTVNGIYLSGVRQGVVNRVYTLNINYKGKSYTASSELRPSFLLDSVNYSFNTGNAFQQKGYYLNFHGKDRIEKGDYFLVRVFRNDTMQIFPVKYLADGDQFLEPGKPIRAQMPYHFRLNDTARVEFLSITKSYHDYLFNLNNQLQSAGGGPFGAQPSNLPTNISGGAFGYFVVASIKKSSFVIKLK